MDDLLVPSVSRTSGKARTSVSSEAYGRYHVKADYKPVVIPKSEAEKAKIRSTLLESFMFSALEENELAIVLDAIKVVEAASGEVVIKQGDDGDVLYVIGAGALDCHRTDGDGNEKFLKTYAPGEFFGELALLYNAPRAATVVAKEACTLYSLDRETFNAIVKELAAKKRETFDNALKKVKILDSVSAYERQQIADAIKV